MDVAKPLIFSGEASKVLEFLMVCKIRKNLVEE